MSFTDSEIDSILAEYEPWFRKKAKQFSSMPEDDLVQEALVATWKELKKYDAEKGIPVDYIMKRRGTWRMLDMVAGKPWTTGESTYRDKGLRHSPIPVPEAQLESFSADCYESVDFTAYTKDITAALMELTPRQREYAVVRYMYGFKQSEIIQYFGYVGHGLFNSSHKDKLKESLAHLESLVK